jgi:hypothetical protein
MRTTLLSIGGAVTLAFALTASGCRAFPRLPHNFPGMGRVIDPSATKDEIVALVNRNITGSAEHGGLMSWQARNVEFIMSPIPVPVPGEIIAEAPRNFRLRVYNPIGGGDELDVGSNSEEFWLWQKQMNPPYLLTARHEDMPIALQHFRIPFQPDWIMQVMGVIPIDGGEYELHHVPDQPYVELAANGHSPDGKPVRRVIRVSTRTGYVTEHALWGGDGRMIASAELDGHRVDKATGAVMPNVIRINWPEHDLNLKMKLGTVQVNPPHLPEMAWQVPSKNGFRRLDMGNFARSQISARSPVQHVEHEVPTAAVPAAGGPAPFPERPGSSSAAAFSAGSGGLHPPSGGQPLPPRDGSAPIGPPGRVRLDEF